MASFGLMKMMKGRGMKCRASGGESRKRPLSRNTGLF